MVHLASLGKGKAWAIQERALARGMHAPKKQTSNRGVSMQQDKAKSSGQGKLAGKKLAILATDGFEQVELTEPRRLLSEAGATMVLVAPKKGKIQGFHHLDKADQFDVDMELEQADAAEFDGLVLPGGVANPDALRMNPRAVRFVKAFAERGKPIAAICHGPWTLVEADAVRGRQVTSWPSLKTDLTNAGARWVDQEVVTDRGLVTSRKPDDIPAFVQKAIEEFAEGKHQA
jgi:protease I